MSRKHNTKHNRSQSHYPDRLRRRGLSNVDVRMEDLVTLRNRQGRRATAGLDLAAERLLEEIYLEETG